VSRVLIVDDDHAMCDVLDHLEQPFPATSDRPADEARP
jgi:hypothetical protein